MKPKLLIGGLTALVVLLSGAFLGAFAYPEAMANRAGDNPSLTIFPVVLLGNPTKNVAEVVGLILEKEGMSELAIADGAFRPAKDAPFGDTLVKFGAFVRENPIRTDYALFAAILGTRKTGVQELRVVVVDKAGAFVWGDRQRPGDPSFDRGRPRNPMTSSMLIAKMFKTRFGIRKVAGASDDGKIAQLWAAKSRMPSKAERAAMKKRRAKMEAAGGKAPVVVFPVQVGKTSDKDTAAHLVETLNGASLCQAQVATAAPHFKFQPTSNEQKRLWDLAHAFRAYVRKNPPTADYALHAEYLITAEKKVWTVHFIVCDRKGDWVIVDFQNEHHADFKRIAPKTLADCDRLVAKRLTP